MLENRNSWDHKIRAVYSAVDDSVLAEATLSGDYAHVHESNAGLTSEVKKAILKLHDLNTKPAVIRTTLLVRPKLTISNP